MKTIDKFIAVVLSLLTIASCGDDLNTVPEGDTITDDQKQEIYEQDPEKLEADVLSLYSSMIELLAIEDWVGAQRHYDFGYAAIMLMMDSWGQDMPSEDSGYNWFASNLAMEDRTQTSEYGYFIWNNLYKQMGLANQVIATAPADSEDATMLNFRGQALAVRAFDYLNLVQLYQYTYVGHENEPAVPLVLDTTTAEEATNNPRATVAEIYGQILADLGEAIAILPETGIAGQVDRHVAYGLRARAHLVMQRYDEAYDDAVAAARGYTPYSIAEVSKPSFNAFNHAWLWGNVIGESNDVVQSGIVNFPAHMCSFTGNGYAPGYSGRYINSALYDRIADTDVRKGWWATVDDAGEWVAPYVDWTWSFTYQGTPFDIAEWLEWQAPYLNVKFGAYNDIYNNATNACDIPLMRVEEMILIQAEAKGLSQNGSIAEGKAILENFVQSYRDPSYTCGASSKEEFVDAVWFQRRIELWGEGLSWFDIMRLKKPVHRLGANFEQTVAWNLPAEAPVFPLIIPEAETNVNPACTNNPIPGVPQAGQTY
ncbi:MAG: RagB/SusD family nutrient uptake outer membrane protein [Alistipes sp.]|nr:RagB/SusD family nutrient uptake outer membrane protein [Alistipes senegalensis]MCM1249679.1 RagB/SusD family nutrient uptake outer membrane protein [Alistipes sp.]